MWALLTGLAGKALEWMLGRLFGSKEPTVADLAAGKADAETELKQEVAANAIQSQAAGARADADLAVVRAVTSGTISVDASANARLRDQFPEQFRD